MLKHFLPTRFLGILSLCLISVSLFATSKLDEWTKEGIKQYKTLIEFNDRNLKDGHPERNWYIFGVQPSENWYEMMMVDPPYAWVNDNNSGYDANYLNSLNQALIHMNNLSAPYQNGLHSPTMQMYVCLSGGLKIDLPSPIPDDVLTGKPNADDIVTYLKEHAGKMKDNNGIDTNVDIADYYDHTIYRENYETLITNILNSATGYFEIAQSRVIYGRVNFTMSHKQLPSNSTNGQWDEETKIVNYSYSALWVQDGSPWSTQCQALFKLYWKTRVVGSIPGAQSTVEIMKEFVEEGVCSDSASCMSLYAQYEADGYDYIKPSTSSHALQQALVQNPCILLQLEHMENSTALPLGEFVQQIGQMCAFLTAMAAAPVLIDIALPAIMEASIAYWGEETTRKFAIGAMVDWALQGCYNYYFEDIPLSQVADWNNLNYVQTFVAGSENTISFAGVDENTIVAFKASLGCLMGGLTWNGPNGRWEGNVVPTGFNDTQCMIGIMGAIVSHGLTPTNTGWMMNRLRQLEKPKFIQKLEQFGEEFMYAFYTKVHPNIGASDLTYLLKIHQTKAFSLMNSPAIRDQILENGALFKKIRNLATEAERHALIDDFLNGQAGQTLLDALDSNPELITSWRIVNPFTSTRLDVPTLNNIKNLLDQSISANLINAGMNEQFYKTLLKNIKDMETNQGGGFLYNILSIEDMINSFTNLNDMGGSLAKLRQGFIDAMNQNSPSYMAGSFFRLRVAKDLGWNQVAAIEQYIASGPPFGGGRYMDIVVNGINMEAKYWSAFPTQNNSQLNEWVKQVAKDFQNLNVNSPINFQHTFSITSGINTGNFYSSLKNIFGNNSQYSNFTIVTDNGTMLFKDILGGQQPLQKIYDLGFTGGLDDFIENSGFFNLHN